jgi:hypothetical protein
MEQMIENLTVYKKHPLPGEGKISYLLHTIDKEGVRTYQHQRTYQNRDCP